MKLLAAVQKGDKSKVPANGLIIIPGITVNKGNVDKFQADLQAKLKS
jgi:ribose transport system substrate-binding protein